jgi:subfamily B ATP-binding cassette protein MsbA
VLETKNPIVDTDTSSQFEGLKQEICLNNVSFNYEAEPVIEHLDLCVKKGTSVALVGPSGSGKTTIANLIPRFYDVSDGSITIDGVDIRNIRKDDLRNMMGIVTQESILFHDSVRNNLLIAKPDATEDQIREAIKIANAKDFIDELPQGLDTIIGDQGNKLSGGQKQRLSIARAVLKNPPIMILDEATSALDTASERMVQDALTKMMKNRTSLVIAHRLSTIQSVDHIVVLSKGKIVEQGKHDTLMAKNGAYKKLIDLQSFEQ